jgi:TolB-like protein
MSNSDAEMDNLSDGITDSLITSLSQLPNLRVMARSTVVQLYKGKEVDSTESRKELKVSAVFTGNVTHAR